MIESIVHYFSLGFLILLWIMFLTDMWQAKRWKTLLFGHFAFGLMALVMTGAVR